MNCCGGTEHKHSGPGQESQQGQNDGASPSWLPIAALLIIGVLVAGLLLTFIK